MTSMHPAAKNLQTVLQTSLMNPIDALEYSPIRGYVVNVDYAVSKLPRVRYYEWLNGVGNLVNPTP